MAYCARASSFSPISARSSSLMRISLARAASFSTRAGVSSGGPASASAALRPAACDGAPPSKIRWLSMEVSPRLPLTSPGQSTCTAILRPASVCCSSLCSDSVRVTTACFDAW